MHLIGVKNGRSSFTRQARINNLWVSVLGLRNCSIIFYHFMFVINLAIVRK